MKRDVYEEKLLAILQLPQFEKVVQTRKNAKILYSKKRKNHNKTERTEG